MQKRTFSFIVLVLACSLTGVFQAFLYFSGYPRPQESREILASQIITEYPLALPQSSRAAVLCEQWSRGLATETDCRIGRNWKSNKVVTHPAQAALLNQTRESSASDVQALQTWLIGVMKTLPRSSTLLVPLQALATRAQTLAERLELVRAQLNEPTQLESAYRNLFEIQLVLHGEAYRSVSGKFTSKKWDFVRLLESPESVTARVQRLAFALQALPWVGFLLCMLWLPLAWWRAGGVGVAGTCAFIIFLQLGLSIIADASVHFGEESSIFFLNPLGFTLERQLRMIGMAACFTLAMICWPRGVLRLARQAMLHPLGLTWGVVLGVIGAYALQGPALGSEVLKIGVSLLAAQLVAAQARAYFLTHKYAPSALSIGAFMKFAFLKKDLNHTEQVIVRHLAPALLNYFLLMAVMLATTALIFNDLGGTLIASAIALVALFFAFGQRPTWFAIFLFGVAALVLSGTDKLQGRIELMMAPMSASISDFARLIGFTEAAAQHSFGLGQLKWCNSLGSCLPVQALSDYVPTVINGIAGIYVSWFIFFLLALLFILMCGASCWIYLSRQGAVRMIAMLSFFLSMATFIQLVLTFLGNWRIIPLTGIGTPLMSIGASSVISPVLALGLLLVVARMDDVANAS